MFPEMSRLNRRQAALALLLPAVAPFSHAQGFPNRPLRIVSTAAAGTGPDIAARQMAPLLAEVLRQPVIVENKPGANGIVAAGEVLKAPRDGYTLLSANISNILHDLLKPEANLRFGQNWLPVTDLTAGPLILVVHPSVAARSVKELVDLGRANPKLLNYGSGGPGSLIQLTGERLKQAARFEMTEVPYKSLGADIADLIGGQLQVGFTVWGVAGQHVRGGRLRALAVASNQRIPLAADIPTLAEAGVPGIVATGWNGIFAPAGTPDEVVKALSQAIGTAVSRPAFQEFFQRDGSEIGGKPLEQFRSYLNAEKAAWGKIIQDAGIRVD